MHAHTLGIYSMKKGELWMSFIIDDQGQAIPTSSQTFYALGVENQLNDATRWEHWSHGLAFYLN